MCYVYNQWYDITCATLYIYVTWGVSLTLDKIRDGRNTTVVNDRTKAALLGNEQWLTTSLQLRTTKKMALVGAAPQVLCFISV